MKKISELNGFFLFKKVTKTVVTEYSKKKRVIKRDLFLVYESDDLLHFESYSKDVAINKFNQLSNSPNKNHNRA